MMELKNKVPAIRFEGFSGEWEEKALGDIGTVAMNKRIFKSQTSDKGDIPFFKIGTFGSQPDAFISRELFDEYKLNYPFPESGDLLISASGSIGRVVEYLGEDQYFQDSNIVWLKHDGKIKNSFLQVFYSIVKWSGLEGSTIKRLYNKNILETAISLPKPEEQTKIGNYFQQLDVLIAQHQQKQNKLLNLKKALLEKMFPKQGADQPEIRFKGFSGAWEEKALGEVSESFSGGTPLVGSEKYYNGDIPFIRSAEINSSSTALFISDIGLKNSSARLVSIGSILYALYGATSGEVGLAKINGAINQAVLAITPHREISAEFVMQWLRKNKPQIISTYLQGGQGNLSAAIVKNLVLSIPYYDEQTKIGTLFKHLDTLLTQHQTQLKKLNNIKQACLEKMFV